MARGSRSYKHLIGAVEFIGEITQADVDQGRQAPVGTKEWTIKPLCGEKWASHHVQGEKWATFDPAQPGFESDMPYGFTSFAESVDVCSRCQSKALAQKIKAEGSNGYTLGERMNNEEPAFGLGKWHGYKSVYPVTRDADGLIIGFIAIEAGWKKQWAVYTWEAPSVTMGMVERGEKLGKPSLAKNAVRYKTAPYAYSSGRTSEGYETDAKRLASKEAALLLFPQIDAQGRFKTEAQVLAEAQGEYDRYIEAKQERARDAAERAERARQALDERRVDIEHVTEAIRTLTAAGDERLTNFEREGLFLAAKRLGIELNAMEAV
jgi:hypothetical protein